MKLPTFSLIMAINRGSCFILLSIFLLTTAMRCDKVEFKNIEDLKGVTALAAIYPEKPIYHVGDTIYLSIKVERDKWKDITPFHKTYFSDVARIYNPTNPLAIEKILPLGHFPSRASLNNQGKWTVEQKVFYTLNKKGMMIILFEGSKKEPGNEDNYLIPNLWPITYTEKHTIYSAKIPILFKNGEQSIKIKIE